MNQEERKALLILARLSVEAAVRSDRPPVIPDGEFFKEKRGAFVTLKIGGMLRGCIGHFTGIGTLGETIRAMAREAALGDPRFIPVSVKEVDTLVIEVSVLSPMERITAVDVIPGTHGLYVRKGMRTGTLLPQVALEEDWDRETFLSHTCMKAGLPPKAWLDPETELFAYTADVFSENKEMK
jgi:AmmeMemoRadiSam system protein A